MFNLSDLVASCNNKHLAWSFRDLVKRDGNDMCLFDDTNGTT